MSKYRIVRVQKPSASSISGLCPPYYIVEQYKTREAPNGDYWEEVSGILNAPSAAAAKKALLDKLTKREVVEEFNIQ